MRSLSNYGIKTCGDELLIHTSTARSVPAGVLVAFHTLAVFFWTSVSVPCVASSSSHAKDVGQESQVQRQSPDF